MKESLKNKKGITLIALVITIIVMLILVTVTIRVATDGNLFTHASNAVKGTRNAILQENYISSEMDIERIVNEFTTEKVTNLTGTTWQMNDTITYTVDMYYDISGNVFNDDLNGYYDHIEEENVASISIFFFNVQLENGFGYLPETDSSFPYGWIIGNVPQLRATSTSAPKTTITGGNDVTNTDLINWLYENATLVESNE